MRRMRIARLAARRKRQERMRPWGGQLGLVRALRRRARRKKGRLEPCREKVLALRRKGASFEDIRLWLRRHRGLAVARSTVMRAVRRWEEEAGG